jgi:hypothetical protein
MLLAGQSHTNLKTRTSLPKLAELSTRVPASAQSFQDFINRRKIGQHQNSQDVK